MEEHIDDDEIQDFLEFFYESYGYDFRQYAPVSLQRRLVAVLDKFHFKNLHECTFALENHAGFVSDFLSEMTITVTELFRDPWVYQSIRKAVFPFLKTYPVFKIWHAGCSTGEEVYSLAILLKEENVYQRARVYATDINLRALSEAKVGLLSNESIRRGTQNYFDAGGKHSLSQYFISNDRHTLFDKSLKENIVFSDHNLAIDGCFGEMQFVMCRNVLIYFSKSLQNRVLSLLSESLCLGGYLCLGPKETLRFSIIEKQYECVDSQARLYKKR